MGHRAVFPADMVSFLVDPGSFEPWHVDTRPRDPLKFESLNGSMYEDVLRETRLRVRDPWSEAILTGRAKVGGQQIVLVLSDFRFMGGSIGAVAGERLVLAFEHAIASSTPVFSYVASGGVRLQEGPLALLQMVKSSLAATQLRNAGLVHVMYLGNPSMGGALASWGSLGSFTFAMPGALIGFAGPRATVAMGREALPPDVQVAENLMRQGLIDDVVPPADIRERVSRVLTVLRNRLQPAREGDVGAELPDPRVGNGLRSDPWRSVEDSRERVRPGSWELLLACGSDLTFLDGPPSDRSADGIIAALGRICGVSAVFVGNDRRHTPSGAVVGPRALETAQRAIQLAGELRLPLVTVIDTPGAQLSRSSEEAGLSFRVAETMVRMATVTSPTLSIIMGQGGGGAALCLVPSDRVLAAANAWLAPIAPEGGSAILWGTPSAALLARRQRITAGDLQRLGIVDEVVAEYPSASAEKERFLERLGEVIERHLRALVSEDDAGRFETRQRRYRLVGSPSS